jgi:hypothetical protein
MATKMLDCCGYTIEVSGSTLKFVVAMYSIYISPGIDMTRNHARISCPFAFTC